MMTALSNLRKKFIVPKINRFRQPEHTNDQIDDLFDDDFPRYNCKVNEHLIVSEQMQEIIKDDNSTPCGCCGSNADVYSISWEGSQVFLPQNPDWAGKPACSKCDSYVNCWKCKTCETCCNCLSKSDCDWSVSMAKQLGPEGVEYADVCWCPLQDTDCLACVPFFNVFNVRGEDPNLWHCSDNFVDALIHNGNFSYQTFTLDKQYRSNEWQDTFMCIKYHGVFNKPRTYHVLYYSNPLQSRYTVVGPTVPREIYHNSFFTSVETSKVIPNRYAPAVEMSRSYPSRLSTLAALATHRIYNILPQEDKPVTAKLLKWHLDNFRVPDGYLLPNPAISCHEIVPPLNFSQAIQLVACADDRDGPEVRDTIVQNQQHNVDLAETTEPSTSHVANVEFGVLPYFYDECHTYPDLTERWVRFTDFQWTTSQAAGAILFRYDLPLDAILATQNTPNALPWRQHAFFRSDMEVMLQINSQPAQSGIIVMGTMYNASELTGASVRVTDVAHVLQMPHIELQAGASNSGVLRIPWMRHFPISPTLDSNWDYPLYYHTLFIAVLAPLRTGADGPVTADLVLQVRYPNLEFYGMRNTVEVVSPTFLTATSWERDLTEEGVEPNPGPIFGSALAIIGGVKTAASTISSIAGTVSSIANSIGSFGSKAKNVVDSTESLLRKVYPKEDMDRPQDVREPVNMYLQQNTSLALASGVNKLKLLQLQAENSVTHPPAFVPTDEQFNSAFVTQVFGQVDLVQWSTNQPRGTQIFSWPVTPLNGKVINDTASAAARYIPTPMGALSSYFSGYHGNMLMRLTFAISKFHSGRVYIVYSPDQSPNSDNVGALYATLIDVQDQSQYTFVVPYQIPSTFAPIYANPRGFTVEDPNTSTSLNLPHYGYVSIYVENELKVMETASPTIDIVVELAGAPDFALQLPCGSPLRNLPSVTPTMLEATGMEGEPVEQQVNQGDERTKVMDASTPLRLTYPAWALNLNETYDIRDVVKRYPTWFSADTIASNTRTETLQYFQVSVYHSPLSAIDSTSPIIVPVWTRTTSGSLVTILSSSQMIACERINFNTNNTISFRVPWTTNASVLSNGIDPTVRFNQLPAYCNGRVHVILEDGVSSFQHISWDVTLGSAGQRALGFRPDLITTLHDAFRFSKSDFNYQLDFTISPGTLTTQFGLTMRVRRAMGDGGNFYIFQGFPTYNNVFNPVLNLIGGQSSAAGTRGIESLKNPQPRTFSRPRAYVASTGLVIRPDPERDLTEDGDVEANPGPPTFSKQETGPSSDPPGSYQPDPESEYFTSEEQEEMGRAGMTKRLYNKVTSYLRTVRRMPGATVDEFWRRYEEKKKVVVDLTDSVRTVSEFVKNVEGSTMDKDKFERAFGAFENIGKASENFNNMYEKLSSPGDASIMLMEQSLRYGTFVINVWQSNSIYQTLLNIIALLSEMGACKIVASHIVEYFSTTAMADSEEEDELSRGWTSLVITGVLATLGVSAVVMKGSNVYDGLLKETKEYFRTGFNVKKFLDSHFKCIKELWAWVKFKVFGGEEAPSTENMAEDLTVWMEKVHTLTEIYNFEHLLSDPSFAQRVMDLQEESGKFDIQFAISKRPAPAMYSVNKGRLQRAIDTLGKQGGLRRNRCTPFCIWVYGASGAGKSHMSDELLINVGEVLGVRSNDPIYYRSLDVEYWNGYNQQKLIAYQDFAKITTGEDFKRHVSELSSLIEPYPVNPPFAELEDKKRIADAVAVLVTSNHAFPQVQNIGMEIDSLFFRRRHVLMHIRFKEEVIKRYREKEVPIELSGKSGNQTVYYPNKILDSDREKYGEYFYLEFGFHSSGISRTAPTRYVSYEEAIQHVREEAILHRQKEMKALERKGPLYARLKPEHEITGGEFRERIFTATADDVPRPVDIEILEMEDVPVNDATSGRMALKVRRTGSAECDCRSEVEGRFKTRFYCEEHYPGAKHQVIKKDEVESAIEAQEPVTAPPVVAYTDEKTIPNNPCDPNGFLMKWFNQRFARKLPEGYMYWHEVAFSCCHQPQILERAYFENVGGKVEVVLDYYLCEQDLPGRTVYHDTTRKHHKVVLTPACPVSVYNNLLKLRGHPVGDFDFSQSDRAGALGFKLLRDKFKCQCDLSKPFRGFCVVDGVVRMYARGTLFELSDPDVQAAALNQCLGIAGTTAEEVIRTYFAYEFSGRERWRHYSRRALAGVADVITTLKYIAMAGAAIWIVYKIYKSVAAMFAMQATASQSGDIRRTDNVKNPPLRFAPARATPVTLTATGEEKIVALSNNFVKVQKGRLSMWGVRLCHDFILVPYHLLVAQGDLEVQTFLNGVYSPVLKFKDSELRIAQLHGEKEALDLAIIRLVGIPAARNIVNFFCKEMESASLKSISCWIKPVGDRVAWGDTTMQPYYCGNVSYSNTGMEKMRTELLGFKMKNNNNPHKCGTLLMSNDVICGMIIAATTLSGESFAVSVSREMIVEGLRVLGATTFDMKVKTTPVEIIGGTPKMLPPEEGDFIPVGKAARGLTYAGKSRIVPSIIHGELSKPFRFPAEQKLEATGACTGYDVVMRGCKKQFKRPLAVKDEEVNEITKYLTERIVLSSPPARMIDSNPVDITTAVVGIPGTRYAAMKLNTAIGWPLMTKYPVGYKKHDIIKVSEDRTEVKIHKHALEEYLTANEGRRRAICAPTVFMDFPKDELLKAGKDTRLINGAPLHHTLDMRRYLGEFLESIVTLNNKIAVGIDVHSLDWVEVNAGQDDVVNEDYKGFGYGFHSQWIDVITEIAVAWIRRYKTQDPEYENVVRCLMLENRNATHIAGDFIFQVMCGSASGVFATDRMNSLANLCYHALCYLRKYSTLVGFWQHYLVVYGDDTRRASTAYSFEEFESCMRSIGITVALDKGGNTFLKREFKPYSYRGINILLAPLPLAIVGDIVNWVKKPIFDPVSALEQSVDSYLSEMFHHGQECFDKARSQIQEIFARMGRNPELKDFNTIWVEKYGKVGILPTGGYADERGEILKHGIAATFLDDEEDEGYSVE